MRQTVPRNIRIFTADRFQLARIPNVRITECYSLLEKSKSFSRACHVSIWTRTSVRCTRVTIRVTNRKTIGIGVFRKIRRSSFLSAFSASRKEELSCCRDNEKEGRDNTWLWLWFVSDSGELISEKVNFLFAHNRTPLMKYELDKDGWNQSFWKVGKRRVCQLVNRLTSFHGTYN